ncbi:hypothetical protein SGM_6001 [Streptomyces griseoaurantiacus M045]|uniref:Uncharacterized protein n=1 Tax=Streptomyces griseoaurantiacus M045 TaxID=996637 RepID=F3NS87_9ACTN|nr:hypothetical protein SGM_6001 [Streptomyces griseoaurantiacus M045]
MTRGPRHDEKVGHPVAVRPPDTPPLVGEAVCSASRRAGVG